VTSSRDDETRAARRLAEASDAIVAGVERELRGWTQREVARILDAWGRFDAVARIGIEQQAVAAGDEATARVTARLRELFAADPAAQNATPLEIVRTGYREPTAVLDAAGVPPVERDAFASRAWPDDRYGLVLHTLGDLGDPDLAPLLLAWGMAKAAVLRARGQPREGDRA
jgi:hypothetical protein